MGVKVISALFLAFCVALDTINHVILKLLFAFTDSDY